MGHHQPVVQAQHLAVEGHAEVDVGTPSIEQRGQRAQACIDAARRAFHVEVFAQRPQAPRHQLPDHLLLTLQEPWVHRQHVEVLGRNGHRNVEHLDFANRLRRGAEQYAHQQHQAHQDFVQRVIRWPGPLGLDFFTDHQPLTS